MEIKYSEFQEEKSFSFWTGVMLGMVGSMISCALGIALLFAH